MNVISAKYVSFFGWVALLCGLLASCATSWENPPQESDDKIEILIRTEIMDGIIVNGLSTKLYVFSSEGTDNYLLSDSLPQVISGITKLKMSESDLNKKNYRFLFIATPEANPEIEVKRKDGYALIPDTEWKNITIGRTGNSLSKDNYYGIKDLTGSEILEQKVIKADLLRFEGVMVSDFTKERAPLLNALFVIRKTLPKWGDNRALSLLLRSITQV